MKNYLALMREILDHGTDEYNVRTGKTCRMLVGRQLEFDVADGFPAVTTKRLYFKSMIGELLGFFRGYTNAAQFRNLGCKIWDENANKTPAWLANPNRLGQDDLGRIYGAQWTGWHDTRVINVHDLHAYIERGYRLDGYLEGSANCVVTRRINQLEQALHKLLTDPSDRRIIVSAWNPAEMDLMCLPSCHMDYRFVANSATKELNVVMTQRSCDYALGIPFNIASTALFLTIMARLSGYTPRKVVLQMTNVHIYEDHLDACREWVNREPKELPDLYISQKVTAIGTDGIAGAFASIAPDQIWLEAYYPLDPIKLNMSA